MQYVINGMVTFNSVYHMLLSTIDIITLNRINSELLHLFIHNNSVPVRRETILNELWEKCGLNISINNLNNYVSMLRKALLQSGCDNVITAIPKHGFIFNADVFLQPVVEKEPTTVGLPRVVLPITPAIIQCNMRNIHPIPIKAVTLVIGGYGAAYCRYFLQNL